MDPRVLKWWGEALTLMASNLEFLQKTMPKTGAETSEWFKAWESLPGLSKPPFSTETMEKSYREWLSFLGAVPRSDYEALKNRTDALETECEKLKQTIETLVENASNYPGVSGMVSPWLELARKTMDAHMEWLKQFQKGWGEEPKSSGKP